MVARRLEAWDAIVSRTRGTVQKYLGSYLSKSTLRCRGALPHTGQTKTLTQP